MGSGCRNIVEEGFNRRTAESEEGAEKRKEEKKKGKEGKIRGWKKGTQGNSGNCGELKRVVRRGKEASHGRQGSWTGGGE
jgi:hypothetical protein